MTTVPVRVFFYGSFMDLELLRSFGVVPRAYEIAELKKWSFTFSPLATLIPNEADSVYGIVAELSQAEVESLYSREDFKHYKRVDITVETEGNKRVLAHCYISKPGAGQKPSAEYLQRIIHAAEILGFSQAYLGKLKQTPTSPST